VNHPANGVTLWFPQHGEAVVKAYGNFDGWALRRYLDDAYRVVERNTGKHPAARFTYSDGVIEVRVGGDGPVNRSTTERGFTIYDEFTDTYGTGIRVQESSSAEEPRCWIHADGEARGISGAPHLNLEQAKRVRDALDAFISENEEIRVAEDAP
jgi:hypothetical protein